MKTLEEIQQWLVQNKSLLQERYKVRELGVFGSYARQEQTETSDVDVLVEFSETPSILKFVNLEQNRGYPRLKPTARYREQRSKAGQDSGQMSGFNARESAN